MQYVKIKTRLAESITLSAIMLSDEKGGYIDLKIELHEVINGEGNKYFATLLKRECYLLDSNEDVEIRDAVYVWVEDHLSILLSQKIYPNLHEAIRSSLNIIASKLNLEIDDKSLERWRIKDVKP